jgi:uncharacterized protein YcaQ
VPDCAAQIRENAPRLQSILAPLGAVKLIRERDRTERLVARIDLTSDRQRSKLLVRAVHLEPGAPTDTLDALRAELSWFGLDDELDGSV